MQFSYLKTLYLVPERVQLGKEVGFFLKTHSEVLYR